MDTSQKLAESIGIAKEINEQIKDKLKIIVGIDGYSASGKSTVLDEILNMNHNVVGIHLDDLMKSSDERVFLMNNAKDKSKIFEFEWYRYDLVIELLRKFKNNSNETVELNLYDYDKKKNVKKIYDLSRNILVIEGIFLFHPELEVNKYFDKRFYIEVDFNKGDERREEREKKRWDKDYILPDHPDSFVIPYMEAYRRYNEKYYPFGANKVFKVDL